MTNPNILSQRYARNAINKIFSEEGRIIADRELWLAVMKAQKELGVDIPAEDIEKFEKAKEDVDLEKIKEIEKKTRHDVKAKIEAYVHISGAGEHIHKGMTSRDLTDNVEQMQIKNAAKVILGKYISVLRHLDEKADQYRTIELTSRTHHQPAQPTLLGRRFSMWEEELFTHLWDFDNFIDGYPLRGIKGPVGTQSDMIRLLGDKKKVAKLEKKVADALGFSTVLDSTGQVYPRSLDYKLISSLSLLASPCENFAKGMRLMAGYELVTEGFKEGQVGSSAMPHKMNTRSSERICGFSELLKMYTDGASRLAGDQWEEGDVSCSVIRRVIIPDSFYASDGLCETTLTVLNEMGPYPAVISAEVDKYLPFLATTQILTAAMQAGIGREEAHEVIKKYSIEEALKMRDTGTRQNNLIEKLAGDPLFINAGLTSGKLDSILMKAREDIGNAREQIELVNNKAWVFNHLDQAKYEPGDIL